MQVVDHQRERLVEPLELAQESLHHQRACELRYRADPLDELVASRIGECVDELEDHNRCASRSPRSTVTQATGFVRLRGPRAQQNGLAASRRRTDERHGAGSGR